eukprot:s8609_g1.t1
MDARLDAVETGLEAVSRLSSATAKGQGKERSQRLVLVLAAGSFIERVVALVDKWNTGAEAARAGAGSGASASGRGDRPEPLKCQLWAAVAEQLVEQGVWEPVRSTLLATPASAIEASFIKPAQDADRPLTFTLGGAQHKSRAFVQGSSDCGDKVCRRGLATLGAQKWKVHTLDPPPGCVGGVFLGHTAEEVTTFFKGKGKGGRGPPPGLGAQKRGAQQRLSVAAQRELKLGKQ